MNFVGGRSAGRLVLQTHEDHRAKPATPAERQLSPQRVYTGGPKLQQQQRIGVLAPSRPIEGAHPQRPHICLVGDQTFPLHFRSSRLQGAPVTATLRELAVDLGDGINQSIITSHNRHQ